MRSAPCASTRLASPATAFVLVQHQRLAAARRHQPAGKRREAAEAQHDVGRAATDDRAALRSTRRAARTARAAACRSLCRARRRNDSASNSTPCCGTSFASMPVARAEPEHAPAARDEFRRDREPGEDVAAGAAGRDHHRTRHVAAALSTRRIPAAAGGSRSRCAAGSRAHAVRDDAAAAEREQRQREALGRQHAHVDADVDERLHADPHADALRDQRRERTLEARRLAADRVRAEQEPDEQRDHDAATPAKPSSSAITASRKSVCASGR